MLSGCNLRGTDTLNDKQRIAFCLIVEFRNEFRLELPLRDLSGEECRVFRAEQLQWDLC